MSEPHPNLWAPWRIDYIKGLDTPRLPKQAAGACFLCEAASEQLSDPQRAEHLVVERGAHGVLLMNRYPYSNGHLLAAPLEHVADLWDLTPQSRAGLMELAELGGRLLREAMHAQGLNVGMNLGRCAGAGVPGHLHMHIVPRWAGDVNFMEVTGQVRVIPQALDDSYAAIVDALKRMR